MKGLIMPVSHEISDDEKTTTIHIEGRFDFSLHKSFREAYCEIEVKNGTFVLDLESTSYMDSSALGMILLLKDYADTNNNKITIKNTNESVYKVLYIAQFNRLMDIEKSW